MTYLFFIIGGIFMKKKILLLVCAMIMALSATCFARALPSSEFTLGGICVAYGPTLDDVEASYGEPRFVSSRGSTNVYYYGDSVKITTWNFGNGPERVNAIEVTANNGWATPAGLTVGMKKSTMVDLYGTTYSEYDKRTGYTTYLYPHMGSGAGASMQIKVDRYNVIRSIAVVD